MNDKHMDAKPKKSFFKKFWWLILLVILAIPIIGFFLKQKIRPNMNPAEMASEKFITANPVDLTQILAISRFRSCAGHWYGATNLFGEPEASSSLKHYFVPQEIDSPSNDKVKVFAPFDGKITEIQSSERGNHFTLVPNQAKNWQLTIFHLNNLEDMVTDYQIKAGELLGYAVFSQRGNDFDISLKARNEDFNENIDSIFPHFTDQVLTEYEAAGADLEEMIIDKKIREESPCPCKDAEPNTTMCNFLTDYLDPKSYYKLKK